MARAQHEEKPGEDKSQESGLLQIEPLRLPKRPKRLELAPRILPRIVTNSQPCEELFFAQKKAKTHNQSELRTDASAAKKSTMSGTPNERENMTESVRKHAAAN